MLARPIGLAVVLLVASPSVLLAQPGAKLSKLEGRLQKNGESFAVNGVRLEKGPLLDLLAPSAGKFVTVLGTVAKDGEKDCLTLARITSRNGSETAVPILQGPEQGALVMTTVEPGHRIDVIGRSRNGQWLKVRIEENDGESEPGWVTMGSLLLGTDTAPQLMKKVTGMVAVIGETVTVNGVRVTNEPFLRLLRGADRHHVLVEGYVTRPATGAEIEVTSLRAVNAQTRNVTIRERAADDAPRMGALVAAGQRLSITGVTPDGEWLTTVVAEGDMRETGYVKASDLVLSVAAPSEPSKTPGVNGTIKLP